MKLDVRSLRYMTTADFRVLTAVEMGMKNHDVVPTELIAVIAGLRHGGTHKVLANLLRYKLIYHDRKIYDGYRLTYSGYDFLALKTMLKRGHISGVGRQIGVGKESDIFLVVNDAGEEMALKLHRLGRVSFKAIKNKRDYLKNGRASRGNWLYMSRLAAVKEHAFMTALHDAGFPVPTPVDQNRHCILMSLVKGYPLRSVARLGHPKMVYDRLLSLICRLARSGLIHCDYNEFNIMISEEEEVTIIDFPQMVSTSHINADMYFKRDVECIRTYFNKRYGYYDETPLPTLTTVGDRTAALDVGVEASGFSEGDLGAFEELMSAQRAAPELEDGDEVGDEDEALGGGAEETKAGESDAAEADAAAADGSEETGDGAIVGIRGDAGADDEGDTDENFGVDVDAANAAVESSAPPAAAAEGGDAAGGAGGISAVADDGDADSGSGTEGSSSDDAGAGLMEPSEPGPRFMRRRGGGNARGGRGRGRGRGAADSDFVKNKVRAQMRRKEVRSLQARAGRNTMKNKEKRKNKAEASDY